MPELVDYVVELRRYFAGNDAKPLRELSNRLIKEAVLQDNKTIAKIAVLAYCLHKILSKEHFLKASYWPRARADFLFAIDELIHILRTDGKREVQQTINKLIRMLDNVDKNFGRYVQNLWDKGKAKLASSAYALGMSLQKATELTGADLRSVQLYIGSTLIHEEEPTTESLREKLEKLRKMVKD
ncbi:MAG: hypothetical protein J7L14_01940 [Candidatus Diapherotrites archaeon]|nr:hypothetical protein [Candidatus Diapherotrites archaeon]